MPRLSPVTRLVLAVAALLALVACGEAGPRVVEPAAAGGPQAPTATATAGEAMSGPGIEAPPPFRLRYDREEVALHPYTYCFGNGCVDGAPRNPPDVGSPEEVRVFVPIDDWTLSVTFIEQGSRCGRAQTVEPTKQDGWYVLRPAGATGRYAVELFAGGGGDMVGQFLWSTPGDGPLATPEATLALIAEHDGVADSYGVELSLRNLRVTPRSAEARITVTAANGRSSTFDAHRASDRCRAEGSVYFDGPDEEGLAAARLGDFPFRYDVTLRLDGQTYAATAHYPRDEIQDYEPNVRLTFTPPLPALADQDAR